MSTCLSNSELLDTEGLTLRAIRHLYVVLRITSIAFVCFIALSSVSIAQTPSPNWGLYYYWDHPGEDHATRLRTSENGDFNSNAGIGGFNTIDPGPDGGASPIETPKRLFHLYSHKLPQVTYVGFTPDPAYLRIQSDIGVIPVIPVNPFMPPARPIFSPAGIEFFSGPINGGVDEQSAMIQSFELNLDEGGDEIIKTQRKAIFNNPSVESPFTNPRGLDFFTMRHGTRGLLVNNDQIRSMRILTTTLGTPHVGIGTDAPLEMLQIGPRLTFHAGGADAIRSNAYFDGTTDRRILGGGASELHFWDGIITLATRGHGPGAGVGDANTAVTFSDWGTNTLSGITLMPVGTGTDERTRVGVGLCMPWARLDVRGLTGSATLSSMAFRVINDNQRQLFRIFDNGQISSGNQTLGSGVKNTDYQFTVFRNNSDAANYHNVFRVEASAGDTPAITELISAGVGNSNVFEVLATGQTRIGVQKIPSSATRHGDNMLSVDGKIVAKEIIVTTNSSLWADYVFKKDYQLKSLSEVKEYIDENGHLPGIPSTEEALKDGVAVGEIQAKLLEKIEELTLHLIKMENRIKELEAEKK